MMTQTALTEKRNRDFRQSVSVEGCICGEPSAHAQAIFPVAYCKLTLGFDFANVIGTSLMKPLPPDMARQHRSSLPFSRPARRALLHSTDAVLALAPDGEIASLLHLKFSSKEIPCRTSRFLIR